MRLRCLYFRAEGLGTSSCNFAHPRHTRLAGGQCQDYLRQICRRWYVSTGKGLHARGPDLANKPMAVGAPIAGFLCILPDFFKGHKRDMSVPRDMQKIMQWLALFPHDEAGLPLFYRSLAATAHCCHACCMHAKLEWACHETNMGNAFADDGEHTEGDS